MKNKEVSCCPNCGSVNVVSWKDPHIQLKRWVIFCEECGFCGHFKTTLRAATKWWNQIHRNPKNWS